MILKIMFGVVMLVASFGFLTLSAVAMRVAVDLIKAGPRAAQEAYEQGDSLKAWWTGKHPNPTRTSIVGRYDRRFGVVMEEAGSRDTDWNSG